MGVKPIISEGVDNCQLIGYSMNVPKPSYPLKIVKELIRNNNFFINTNAQENAWNDFGWRADDIKKCLLKLNSKYYSRNREKNHFHKTEVHSRISGVMMDYYKAKNIMENFSVYTHFYINPSGILIISSFKEL